jgi:23S rRNA pseudouridine2605 synthase
MKRKSVMTLDRVLSRFGIASRSEAQQAIAAGRLKVNGRVVRDPNAWVEPSKDVVHLDGTRLRQARRVYLVLYKPKGVITSHGDPDGRKTVYDLIDPRYRWVSPVGRLDLDSSGLLLLTNDTEFANHVTSPESEVEKTYLVKLNGILPDEQMTLLEAGIAMKRGDVAQPRAVRRIEDRGNCSVIEVVLCEGKNREVRRMMEAVGFRVRKLVRTRIGPVTLEGLQVGQSRELTQREVKLLKTNTGRGSTPMDADF